MKKKKEKKICIGIQRELIVFSRIIIVTTIIINKKFYKMSINNNINLSFNCLNFYL